jgi:hypothetical protein
MTPVVEEVGKATQLVQTGGLAAICVLLCIALYLVAREFLRLQVRFEVFAAKANTDYATFVRATVENVANLRTEVDMSTRAKLVVELESQQLRNDLEGMQKDLDEAKKYVFEKVVRLEERFDAGIPKTR